MHDQITPGTYNGEFTEGWLNSAIKLPSPNFDSRPVESQSDSANFISLLVIHNISLPPKHFGVGNVEKFFCNTLNFDAHPYFDTIRNLEVSSHFFILRTGQIIQFVSCGDRAWHAGVSAYQGREKCNDYSIGIELEGADDIPYSQKQYKALAQLTKQIQHEYPAIGNEHIVGHADIAPDRKTDPGPSFEWDYFKRLLGEL